MVGVVDNQALFVFEAEFEDVVSDEVSDTHGKRSIKMKSERRYKRLTAVPGWMRYRFKSEIPIWQGFRGLYCTSWDQETLYRNLAIKIITGNQVIKSLDQFYSYHTITNF